jgi:hypothetical protein
MKESKMENKSFKSFYSTISTQDISSTIKAALKTKTFQEISNSIEDFWISGACVDFSKALIEAFGGEEYLVLKRGSRDSYWFNHSVVLIGNNYYDATGKVTESEVRKAYGAVSGENRSQFVAKANLSKKELSAIGYGSRCQLPRPKGRSLPTPMTNQRINIGSLDFNDHFL